jgi:hypothetical protein
LHSSRFFPRACASKNFLFHYFLAATDVVAAATTDAAATAAAKCPAVSRANILRADSATRDPLAATLCRKARACRRDTRRRVTRDGSFREIGPPHERGVFDRLLSLSGSRATGGGSGSGRRATGSRGSLLTGARARTGERTRRVKRIKIIFKN